jgi:hypothetical protein
MSGTPTIKKWLVLGGDTIDGEIYNHPRYADGYKLTTSAVKGLSEKDGVTSVTTQSGSVYILDMQTCLASKDPTFGINGLKKTLGIPVEPHTEKQPPPDYSL